MQETLWKKLQRSLGLERHSAPSPLSHSSQPELQQTPLTRRFLLETSSPLTDERQAAAAAVSSSRSTFDGWRSRDSQLTVTSRCRSLPGGMHDSGGQGVDSWERSLERSSTSYRQSRARRNERSDAASVPLRPRRSHHHHQHLQQQQQAAYTRHTSSPTYVTPSSHLALPVHRSRGAVVPPRSYVASQHSGARGGVVTQRHVSPSHFSWPGASFELQTGFGDDEEGRSSGGTRRSSGGTQGAAEPTSPSLPSSTSTATNACTRPPPLQPCDVTATNDDVTPSNGDVDTEIADVTAAVCADNGDVATSDDVKSDHNEETRGRRRRSCEFNLLDDDDFWAERQTYDVTDEWAWSSRSDWADVICVIDDNQVTAATTTSTITTTTTATAAAENDNEDDDAHDDVTQTAINETVMKCIESCDKVLLRHSTAIR